MREQVKFLKALASESRLQVLLLLKEHPQCVNAIASRLKMTQPAVSQHLRALKEVGLVRAQKRGTSMHYEMDSRSLERHGKALAAVFGGWIELRKPGKGTANCPPELLKECHGGRTARSPRSAHPGRGRS
jgi:DNA-binding transcriptional ArsR family regulator